MYGKIFLLLTESQEKEKNCIRKRKIRIRVLDGIRTGSIFVGANDMYMEYAKRKDRSTPRCLECGDKINYGRTDKKFCSEDCKNRHHNHLARASRLLKRRVISALEKNYSILDDIVREGKTAVWISELTALGFNPGYATSSRKQGRHHLYHCFDISYVMTPNRISSISKIQNLSLPLPVLSDGYPDGDK